MNAARAAVAAAPSLLLAFDFGAKRVGVASGNSITSTATPLTTLVQEGNQARFAAIGKLIAEKAKKMGIEAVAFDRSGYRYHGRVKALAEAARENGLKF